MRARATPAAIAPSPLLRSAYRAAGVTGSRGITRPAGVGARSGRVRAEGLLALPVAGLLLALWLIVDPRTPDLAAQVYRVGLFEHLGFSVWDEHWYAGHYLPGYSLLFPPLASLLGLRVVAVLSVLASCVLFERLTLRAYGPYARWGAAMFAVAAVGDVWIGRLAFAMGVSLALACVLALQRRWRRSSRKSGNRTSPERSRPRLAGWGGASTIGVHCGTVPVCEDEDRYSFP